MAPSPLVSAQAETQAFSSATTQTTQTSWMEPLGRPGLADRRR